MPERRIPACIQVFAASLLPSEIWIIPGIIPALSLRKEGTLEVLPCRGGAGGCRTLRRCGFFSSGADAPLTVRSLWRNGRARWTSNPEVPGSSPGRDDLQAGVSFILVPFPSQVLIHYIYNTPEGLHGEGMTFPSTADGCNIPALPSPSFLLHHLPFPSFPLVSPPSRCFNPTCPPSAVPHLIPSS